MIYLSDTAQPPEQKLQLIINRMRLIKQRCQQINPRERAIVLLELSTFLVDSQVFLNQYAGDQELIDFANAKAVTNPKYPDGYDVQVDFASVGEALQQVISAIKAINFSGSVYLNADNRHEWQSINASLVVQAIRSVDAVLVN